MEKLCRNSNGAKISRKLKSGKDEGDFETKFMIFYKNVLITLQFELRQKGGASAPVANHRQSPPQL